MKRKKFVTRTIRPDGTVRVYGRDFACRADVSPFIGDSPIFGVYFDHHGEATGLALWGHEDDEWPGRYCHEDGHFYWMFWEMIAQPSNLTSVNQTHIWRAPELPDSSGLSYADSGGDVLVESIVGCARCHGDGHDDLRFRKLTHPVILDGGIDATRWAMCPTTGEPILWATIPIPGTDEEKLADGKTS